MGCHMSEKQDVRNRLADAHRLIVSGHTVDEALRRAGVSRAIFSAWLDEHNGHIAVPLNVIQNLQSENRQMRRQVAKSSMERPHEKLLGRLGRVGRLFSED